MINQERTEGLKGLGQLLPMVKYEIVGQHPCEVCGQPRLQAKGVEPFGPKKGQPFNRLEPCKHCEEQKLFREQQEKLKAEARERKKGHALALFKEKSLINTKLQNASFQNYNPPTTELANAQMKALLFYKAYDRENPRNLALIGTYGTGKSHLAISLAKVFMNDGYTCLFMTVQKMLSLIKHTYDRGSQEREADLLHALETVDVLILDDIGAEQLTADWGQPKLFEILDARQGKCTIYTSNLNKEELIPQINARNVSRMFFDTEVVEMYGPDYRG